MHPEGEQVELLCRWNSGTLVADAVESVARRWLGELFPGRVGEWRFRSLGEQKLVADSPARVVAVDSTGLRCGILFVSAPERPSLVARGAENATSAKEFLGSEVGAAVLSPVRTSWVDGLSIALYPWRTECASGVIRGRLLRPRIRSWALRWLRGVAQVSSVRYPVAADLTEVRRLLEGLASCDSLAHLARSAIDRALSRLSSGAWRPRLVLDHNDLWSGNIMANRDQLGRPIGPSSYVVIDWAGANLRGGGFNDLVRLARGLSLSSYRLREEIAAHCGVLSLAFDDAEAQALFGLGWLYQNLGSFPVESFVLLVSQTIDSFRQLDR